jgi:hypothetical protein
MPDDYRWIEDLDPDQAQAALDGLAEHFKDGMTAREAVELHKMQRALQAKIEGRKAEQRQPKNGI